MYDLSILSTVVEYHDAVIWFCNKVLALGSDKIYSWNGVGAFILIQILDL